MARTAHYFLWLFDDDWLLYPFSSGVDLIYEHNRLDLKLRQVVTTVNAILTGVSFFARSQYLQCLMARSSRSQPFHLLALC
jgi:hypothetical protein